MLVNTTRFSLLTHLFLQRFSETVSDKLEILLIFKSPIDPEIFVDKMRFCIVTPDTPREIGSFTLTGITRIDGKYIECKSNVYAASSDIDLAELKGKPELCDEDGVLRKLQLLVEIRYKKSADVVESVPDEDLQPLAKKCKVVHELFDNIVTTKRKFVTLKTDDGKELQADLDKLSEKSILFSQKEREQSGLVKLSWKVSNMEYEILREVLRFIYCGEIENLQRDQVELFRAAKRFGIKDLADVCLRSISDSLHGGNAADFIVLANSYKIPELFDACCMQIKA